MNSNRGYILITRLILLRIFDDFNQTFDAIEMKDVASCNCHRQLDYGRSNVDMKVYKQWLAVAKLVAAACSHRQLTNTRHRDLQTSKQANVKYRRTIDQISLNISTNTASQSGVNEAEYIF